MSQKPCNHGDLRGEFAFNHIMEGERDELHVGSFLQIRIFCALCGHPFGVRGMIETPSPSQQVPTCAIFGVEGRIPVVPLTDDQVVALARRRLGAAPTPPGGGGLTH